MIKVQKIRAIAGLRYTVDIIADTKAEVSDSSYVVGLEKNAHIDIGSTVLTADGHFAIRNSSGSWKWQGDDEDGTRSVQTSVSPQLNIGRSLTKGSTAVDIDDNGEEPFIEEVTKR